MVALVQVLPERLWTRTGLGNATRLALRSHAPGMPNHRLEQRRPYSLLDSPTSTGFPVPVVNLEPESLAAWAGLVAGRARVWTPGFLLPLDDALERQRQAEAEPQPDLSPEERWSCFAGWPHHRLTDWLPIWPLPPFLVSK